jgi:2,3-dihydro-2,3-dihydroxybenzoate dehydrogenase
MSGDKQRVDRSSIALVTGAASGIGLAVATALCRQGRSVALCDRDPERLGLAADGLRSELGADLRTYPLDVRDGQQVERVVAELEQTFGLLSSVALVAGVLHLGTASEISAQAFEDSLATNLMGVFNVARATTRRMSARRRGALVTVASNAGNTPRLDMAAYCSSKAAAIMFTKCLGLELAAHGVRCNVVCPGSTDTPMLRAMVGDNLSGSVAGNLERHRLGIPLGRVASAEDIANVVLYLLSDQARHITMQALTVDGGATL